jgi:hypothetical protein
MPRTTESAVEGIIEVEDDDDLTPFIETANLVVTDNCTASGYSDAKLEMIERWLSAHYYAILRPRNFLEQVDTLREQIESKVDLGFNVTRYGQQAMRLDNAGNLGRLDAIIKKGLAVTRSVIWLGKRPEITEE